MAVSISAAAARSGDIKVLSAGTAVENHADSAYHDVATISVPALTAGQFLFLEIISSASGNYGGCGLDNVSGNSASMASTTGQYSQISYNLTPDGQNTSRLVTRSEVTTAQTTQTIKTDFPSVDLHVASSLYIKGYSIAGGVQYITWTCYLIGAGVK